MFLCFNNNNNLFFCLKDTDVKGHPMYVQFARRRVVRFRKLGLRLGRRSQNKQHRNYNGNQGNINSKRNN